jgi:hypothetical protein
MMVFMLFMRVEACEALSGGLGLIRLGVFGWFCGCCMYLYSGGV